MDEYAKYIISSEELRYIDYCVNMKTKRHLGHIQQVNINNRSSSTAGLPAVHLKTRSSALLSYQILHSLPIIYPYDDSKLNKEEKKTPKYELFLFCI